MIRIVNWLLTRRCNLNCEYCAIVKNYDNIPDEYPRMSHYIKHEMTTDYVIEGLREFKKHNPECFHIFYGGEPLLRKDLPDIINFCNTENIQYTIISNNTPEVRELTKSLFEKVDRVSGFTASIDPVIFEDDDKSDRVRKSIEGFESLVALKTKVNDVVAEITVTNDNIKYLYRLVKKLTKYGINSSVTFIDIAKNPYYDFSNVTEQEELVRPSAELAQQFQLLSDDDNLDIHMKNVILPAIWDALPSELNCKIDNSLHNVTVDADGSIRLCLRIRGVETPRKISVINMFDSNGDIVPEVYDAISKDKKKYCKLCNHTCQIMSRFVDNFSHLDSSFNQLVHMERRLEK